MIYKAKKTYRSKEVASKYEEKRFKSLKGWFVNKRELGLIDKALKYAGITPPATILDIPCGTGRVSVHLAKMGFDIIATDISSEMISYAKEKVNSLNDLSGNIKFEVADAECLPYVTDSFDACISLRFLGHIPDKSRKRILKEMIRVTKKYLILAYYLKSSLQYHLRKRKRRGRGIEWHPLNLREVEEELTAVGLKKVKIFFLLPLISETVIFLCAKQEL